MDAHATSRLHDAALDATIRRHERLMAEARAIVDAGNERGVVLRLTGGLAVRHYAIDLEFAEREYSDIDLIGLKRQVAGVGQVFRDLGYVENKHVAVATVNGQLQFLVGGPGGSDAPDDLPVFSEAPSSDHIDVFLDAMRMDHQVDFRDRLGSTPTPSTRRTSSSASCRSST